MSRRIDSARPHVLGLFRIVVGLLFAVHGTASLFGVPESGRAAAALGSWPGWYAAVIQLVCGVLVMLGLGSRSAAFLASGSMAYAYFTVHQGAALWPSQNNGESSALFAWAFLLLVFTGPGAFAAQRLFVRRGASGVGAPEAAEGARARSGAAAV
ncbi:DoxX family protein [Streptomyces sp. BI20]|uniref:DoxX family protein n=1 Tax=Streptomyces sp. BI20 TaxID=3403460 RepID=UPI003C793D72